MNLLCPCQSLGEAALPAHTGPWIFQNPFGLSMIHSWRRRVCAVRLFPYGVTGMDVRQPTKAGSWYPADAKMLTAQIDAYLSRAADTNPGKPLALICPHAGYAWSGQAAAEAFKLAGKYRYKRVILLAPNHYIPGLEGPSLVDVNACRTPLGMVEVDREVVDHLRRQPLFDSSHGGHEAEHSLELQLPFLQRILGSDFKLVPIVIGEMSGEDQRQAAETLRLFVDDDTLLIASSDFTHYGGYFGYTPFEIPRDFDEEERNNYIESAIRSLDYGAIGPICHRDVKGFEQHLEETRDTICGRNAIGILLNLLPGESEGILLDYCTSASMEEPGSRRAWDHSVSYAPIAFVRNPDYLNDDEQRLLLSIARKSIARGFDRTLDEPVANASRLPERLRLDRGVFVTLSVEGDLRGCVGYIDARMPLYQAVVENACNAAFRDTRFTQLTQREFQRALIEISVLSPAQPIHSWEDIELGRHGIILTKGRNSAVFLPHVATEQRWDLETTLEHLSRKAGLSSDAWREGCDYEVFTAQVFHE